MARPSTRTNATSDADLAAVTTHTAETLADQPKRKVRLHQAQPGDKALLDETVCVNGHIFQIKRGVEVEVPETVYEVLEQAGRL